MDVLTRRNPPPGMIMSDTLDEDPQSGWIKSDSLSTKLKKSLSNLRGRSSSSASASAGDSSGGKSGSRSKSKGRGKGKGKGKEPKK